MRKAFTSILLILSVPGIIACVPIASQSPTQHRWSTEGSALLGAWGNSPSDVFAVGEGGTVLHYDGNNWTRMSSGTPYKIGIVCGISPTDVFAIGAAGTILHYDGNRWTEMVSGTEEYLGCIWGTTPSDVFVAGTDMILHYDGNSWSTSWENTDIHTPMWSSDMITFYDMWGSSESDVFAVGRHWNSGVVMHYDGRSWNWVNGAGSDCNIAAIWGSSSSDIFTADEAGTIRHYDGMSWTVMTDVDFYPRHIWGSGPSDVFCFGSGGTVHYTLHYDGTAWSGINIPGSEYNIIGMWGRSSSDIFTVDGVGTIRHYDGIFWKIVGSR